MTPKQTALTKISVMLLISVAVSLAISALFKLFAPATVVTAFGFALLAYVVKMVYDMEVDKATRLQRLNETR